MKRFIDMELDKWKGSKNRESLIFRGASQVGKTYSVESFGKRSFSDSLTLNFELNRDLIIERVAKIYELEPFISIETVGENRGRDPQGKVTRTI